MPDPPGHLCCFGHLTYRQAVSKGLHLEACVNLLSKKNMEDRPEEVVGVAKEKEEN